MQTDCPDPKEVADFHFLQLKTLRIVKENENVPAKSVNALASASKHGLLFVGIEGGFKVIKLEVILTIDEDKENRSTEENFSCVFVPSGTPVVLSVNASQTTLAVVSGVIIKLYSISTYSGSGAVWQPFCTNALSLPGTELQDFAWNPAMEGLYAVCFSNGSLHIHEVAGSSIKPISSLQAANAVSVCWSPKGKQLVCGKGNGSFSQYKPNLEEVKTIVPPSLEETQISVTSIYWISNTVFAVLYVVGDTPNLFLVFTPKGSPVMYTNFYDVCLGNNCSPHQKYLLHLEPLWGILVCASLDSIEIAVLGDMPNWVQWDLKEDGKALLPGKDGATHAIGMTAMYSAQRQLVISESELYPPMPVMFLLTNNGLLVSFHMINANATAASLVSPPLPLENEKSTDNGSPAVDAAPVTLPQAPPSSNQPLMSSTFTLGSKPVDQSSVSQNGEFQNINLIPPFGQIEKPSAPSLAAGQKESFKFGIETPVNSMQDPEVVSFNEVQKSQEKTPVAMSPLLSAVEKRNEVQSSTQNSYMTAIISEIQNFVKELQDLKQLQNSTPSIDSEEDMMSLKTFAFNLHNFQKDIFETMQSFSSDIYTLKNVLLESFVRIEEACSRERRKNDHSYMTMLKERALDPSTAKRMQKMNQHYQYLNTQMQEVSDKLDQDWIHLLSNKKKAFKINPCISSTEAIYKTIVNNQKIIHTLRKKVEMLLKKSEEKKLRNTTKSANWGRYHKRSMQEDLSKLADEFLQVKIAYPEEGEPTVSKKLSSESQTVIKTFLKQTNVVTVRPIAVYSPSQSRLLSNVAPSEDFSGSSRGQEKDVSPKSVATPSNEKETPKVLSSGNEIVTPKISSKISLSFEESPSKFATKPYAPVYEPITPPDTASTSVPVNKTLTGNHMLGISITKEKFPEHPVYHQPLSTAASTLNLYVKDKDADPGIVSCILSNVKSNTLAPPNISCPVEAKIPAFSQTFSEIIPPSTCLAFPKTLSFTPSIQKATESTTSKPLAFNNSTIATSSVSSFQFPFDQRKEIPWPMPPVVDSTASLTSVKIKSQLESHSSIISESSQFHQPEISPAPLSSNIFNLTSNQSTSFTLPATKTSQIPSPSLFPVPENKNSTLFSVAAEKGLDASQAKSNVGFSFQKSSDNADQPNESVLKKDETSRTPSLASVSEVPALALNLVNKTADSKLSGNQVLNNQPDDTITTQSANSTFSPNQISFATNQITEDSVTTSNQPNAINTFSNFSDLQQSLTLSDLSASKLSVISSSITSVPVSETVVSSHPQLTSSAGVTASSSNPAVVSTVTIISHPDPIISKPSTPVMPILLPQTTTSASTAILFEQNTTVSSPVTSECNSHAIVNKTESSATPAFGLKSALFSQPAAEASSFFSTVSTETPTFGQTSVTQTTPFGQTASNSSFTSASGGFFSQTPSFGATVATTTSSSDFSNQTSTFSFDKPAFGQTTGSFGLAKSFFGQNTAPFTQAGSTSSFSLAQNSNSVFGQGSFFSGLGGKPSEENASKNVFGLSNSVKSTTDTNLFRNSSVTSFGAVNSGSFSGTGSFSSGSGSVAQAGFGSFQQTPMQQPGSFGSAPSFGGAPTFGSPPAFGASPTFGSGNPLSSSIFGQQQVSSNFSNFANASSPTFGSLASQSPGFGNSSPVGGFGSQGTAFGSSPVFGGSSFGGQSTGFGSPSSPPSNSSAFTQWRN